MMMFFLFGSSLITNILGHYYLFHAWELFTKTVIEATVTGIGFSDGFQDKNLLFQGAIFRFHVGRVMFQSEIKVLKRPQGVFVRGGNTSWYSRRA